MLQQRDYQDRIVAKTIEKFNNEAQSVGIVSPTGSGKTICAFRILKHLEDQHGFTTNWVAMRRTLLHQAAEANSQYFNMKKINFVSMFDKKPPKADVICLDECQHAPCQSFINIDSQHQTKFLLGLSATPFRTDTLKLPFQYMIQDAGIHRLIQEKWLTPYNHYCLQEYKPETIAKAFITDRERWGKSICFFHTMEECRACQSHLTDAGVKSEIITGKTPDTQREELLDAFDAGDYPIIINIMILAEGFDCPDLRTVFVRDSGKLPTIQMSGRAFRLYPGKTHCNIVQSKTAPWQFTKTAKPEKAFIQHENHWLSLGDNSVVGEVVKQTIEQIADIEVTMPIFIITRQKKRKAISI